MQLILLLEDGKVVVNKDFLVLRFNIIIMTLLDGLDYEVDLYRDFGDSVVYMKKNGKDIDLEKVYYNVVNNYRASNTSIYPSYEGAEVVGEINIDISEIIINYIKNIRL